MYTYDKLTAQQGKDVFMYSGIQKIEEVIEYIESNITEQLDCEKMAKMMDLSVYEFRRIFSFVVGCPVSDYIRKRRLSLAACDIMTNQKQDMLEISEKYGYTSQSAFIKAFGEQHGVSPTAYLKEGCEIKLFTRPRFQLNISGRDNIIFRVVESEEFYIQGYRALSMISDSCCCENVWNAFYEENMDQKLVAMGCNKELYVSYYNKNENVDCTIGTNMRVDGSIDCGLSFTKVPRSRFACFKMHTVDDDIVNEMYSKILYEWLPSANMKKREEIPIIEVYPFDMSGNEFEWEIRIPIF